jgi:hypothetical protein
MTKEQRLNRKYLDQFEQAGIVIHKMFWIAGSFESDELKDVLTDDMNARYWAYIIPGVDMEIVDAYLDEDRPNQIFFDYGKFGFLAETRYAERSKFSFDKSGMVTGCSISGGIQSIDFVYGETIEQLAVNILKAAEENLQRCIKNDKKKKIKPSN